MDLSYAQVKRLYKKKKYKFSVGVYQWIQLGMCLPIWSWKGKDMMGNPTIGLDFQNHNKVFGVNFNPIDKVIGFNYKLRLFKK